MLVRIPQLLRVGRFGRWDSNAARRDEVRFKRLTLIFGRNASGKSTIVRTCSAAAAADSAELEFDRTLESEVPPEVTLELDGGVCRFNGTAWTGPAPKVTVFDRRFIEANVYTGRRSSKEHRKELLRLALGAHDVAYARELDDLTKRGRRLALELNPHDAAIEAAASSFQLAPKVFLSLTPIADLDLARTQADKKLNDAQLAKEVEKRARPNPLPAPPTVDFSKMKLLLTRDATRIGDEAAAKVRSHLDRRLHGRGETWIREGLAHQDLDTCPFCAQSLNGVELVDLYRAWFDRSYDELTNQIEIELKELGRLQQWWRTVRQVGQANVKAFDAWNDLPGIQRPSLESDKRKAELDATETALRELLEAKRQNPTKGIEPHALDQVSSTYDGVRAAVLRYNEGLSKARAEIEKRVTALSALSVEALKREINRIAATAQRHSETISRAAAEKVRLEQEQEQIKQDKEAADARMKERTHGKLASFTSRINNLLAMLCADFQLEELGTERGGGATGARFTVRVEAGCLEVSSAESEVRFARVLSDGDRSTLAFAIFLLSLEEVQDIADRSIVFDDPMTSQDSQRTEATAEQISKLAVRAKQVIVLSHHAPFLNQIAYDWRRHQGRANELVEVELDKGTRALVPWSSEDHLQSEHVRRIKEIEAFVRSSASDRLAQRMHGEIRKLLEGHVRLTYPHLFDGRSSTLEPIITRLKSNDAIRRTTGWNEDEVAELERLCAFGARGNHYGSAVPADAPSPEQVRSMARRALAFVQDGLPAQPPSLS